MEYCGNVSALLELVSGSSHLERVPRRNTTAYLHT